MRTNFDDLPPEIAKFVQKQQENMARGVREAAHDQPWVGSAVRCLDYWLDHMFWANYIPKLTKVLAKNGPGSRKFRHECEHTNEIMCECVFAILCAFRIMAAHYEPGVTHPLRQN